MKQIQNRLLQQECKLKDSLKNSKIFLNMCIHDMRNPTNSICLGLEQMMRNFNQIDNLYKHHLKYNKKCGQLQLVNSGILSEGQNEMFIIEEIPLISRILSLHELAKTYHSIRCTDCSSINGKLDLIENTLKMTPIEF